MRSVDSDTVLVIWNYEADLHLPLQTNINIFSVVHKFIEESTRFTLILLIVYFICQLLYTCNLYILHDRL